MTNKEKHELSELKSVIDSFINRHGENINVSNILIYGAVPKFENNTQKYIAAMKMAYLLRKLPYFPYALIKFKHNICKFLASIGREHRVVFLKQLTLPMLERIVRTDDFSWLLKEMMRVVV